MTVSNSPSSRVPYAKSCCEEGAPVRILIKEPPKSVKIPPKSSCHFLMKRHTIMSRTKNKIKEHIGKTKGRRADLCLKNNIGNNERAKRKVIVNVDVA